MRILNIVIAFISLLFAHSLLHAQTTAIYDPYKDPRVYLRPYYDKLDIEADEDAEDDCNNRHFMRWLDIWHGRMKPDGSIIGRPYSNIFSSSYYNAAKTTGTPPAWQSLGPSSASQDLGIGMVHCIAFHPTKKNIIYAGAAAGGFWMTTDTGAHWTTTTDALGSLGIDDIILDPQHPDTIYASTGDKDFWSCTSIGLIKSTDGGNTWMPTGLTFSNTDGMEMIRTRMDPNNPAILFAAAKTSNLSSNVYKSINAGATWSIVYSINEEISDLQIHPTNGNYVYFVTRAGSFYATSNEGVTWVNSTANVPYTNPGGGEVATLAVTPAAPDNVYLMAEGNPGPGDMNCGVYVSTNKGATFVKPANNATNDTVQWYGYVMAVSPTDPDRMYVGGGYVYQSNDRGATYSVVSNSSHGSAVHVDIHDVQFRSNNEAFIGCDGGIYRCTDLSGPYWNWNYISGNMVISQPYGISSAANSRSMFVMGMQDNGSGRISTDKVFYHQLGGDGMQPAVNPLDSNNYYESYQNGVFYKTNDNGQTWDFFLNTNVTQEDEAWVTPISIYPRDTNVIWTGYSNVWRTNDQGKHWHKLGNIPPNVAAAPIWRMCIAPSDTNIIYVMNQWGYGFWKTMDNGDHWSQVPYASSTVGIDNFAVDSANPYHLWCTAIGYGAGQKIFESTDTGNVWKNISYDLPNVYVDAVIYENKPPHRVFVGTDMGVYSLHPHDTTWQLLGTGFPNVDVKQLEIHNLTNTLRAATYGRGVWQCTLDTVATLSVNNISNGGNGADQFNVYPNPARNGVTVTGAAGINKLQLTNILGQEIFSGVYNTNNVSIDLSLFAPGIYFIRINDQWVKKLLKE